jgi:hypothetical protein
MKHFNLKKKWKPILFTLVGGTAGFLYAYFVGCHSGTCPLTSNKFIATGFFALFGYILSLDSKKKNRKKEENHYDTNQQP